MARRARARGESSVGTRSSLHRSVCGSARMDSAMERGRGTTGSSVERVGSGGLILQERIFVFVSSRFRWEGEGGNELTEEPTAGEGVEFSGGTLSDGGSNVRITSSWPFLFLVKRG